MRKSLNLYQKNRNLCFAFIWSMLFVFSVAHAQTSYNLYVTYYDFHEDGTNPEFECGYLPQCNAYTADLSLDMFKKPVSTCPEVHLAKWYRPWTPGDTLEVSRAADTLFGTVPIGRVLDTAMTLLIGDSSWIDIFDTTVIPAGVIRSDTLFKNVAVVDSIEMDKVVGTTNYRMKNSNLTTDTWGNPCDIMFYPLDGKGFEALGYPRMPSNNAKNHRDRGNHNYCFTMELHARFVYKGGEKIYISGKGNKWIYLNNTRIFEKRLHNENEPSSDTFSLDTFNLTLNDTIDFDLFDASQKTPDHELGFSTNITFLPQTKPVVGILGQCSQYINRAFDVISIGNGLVVRVPDQSPKLRLSVVDVFGKTCLHGNLSYVKQHVNSLPAGVFFVTAEQGDISKTIISKITISR